MKPIVRILAAIAGIIALLLVVFVFMIDGIIESQIEKQGTKAVGARVDLAAADLSFFPLGLTLSGLDVTDPSAPMTNAVSVREISFALDPLPLLKKEVIVERMAMKGIRLNTPRKTSGVIAGATAAPPAKESAGCTAMSLPPLTMPDVKEILGKEKLQSSEYIQGVKDRIASEKDRQQKLLDSLPNQQTFDEYRQRIEKLTAGGGAGGFGALLSAPNEIQNIQKDIEKDLQNLKRARQQLQQEAGRLQQEINMTSDRITADVSRLASKYALSGEGLKNMSKALFGEAYCGWVTKAIDWYERFKGTSDGKKPSPESPPAAGDGAGVFVWVKTTAASLELAEGVVEGTVKNISNQPGRVGEPLTADFTGRNVGGIKQVGLNGLLDLATAGKTKMDLSGKISGLALTDFRIPGTAGFPVTLSKAMADIDFKADMLGNAVNALATANLADVLITTGKPAEADPLAKALASALSTVSNFTATADARGTLSDYTVSIRSDLDRMLSQSLGNVVSDQTAALKTQFNQAIATRVSGQTAQASGELNGFEAIQGEIEKRLNLVEGLLKNGGLPF